MNSALEQAAAAARACRVCAPLLPRGPRPLLQVGAKARLLIIGQAPGTRAHETGLPWNDASGERLRAWMGVDRATFYDPALIAIVPMGLCYPGRLERGGDAPPRPECAPLWHPPLLAALPAVRLTLLVGGYAIAARLEGQAMTRAVRNFRATLPGLFPLPHPSWRTRFWEKANPWFKAEALPALREAVASVLGDPS